MAGSRLEAVELERTVAGRAGMMSLPAEAELSHSIVTSGRLATLSDLSLPSCCRQVTKLTRIMRKEGRAAAKGVTGGDSVKSVHVSRFGDASSDC